MVSSRQQDSLPAVRPHYTTTHTHYTPHKPHITNPPHTSPPHTLTIQAAHHTHTNLSTYTYPAVTSCAGPHSLAASYLPVFLKFIIIRCYGRSNTNHGVFCPL
eukprot:GHVQ01017206.1.p1 GENE.GHVQ01017206.1~~GHVQ01017206.1.p1  ORF type:complete len:103 (-),score=15.71 GHVQ01017206.1:157-465(-)